jgi:adenylate cyclase
MAFKEDQRRLILAAVAISLATAVTVQIARSQGLLQPPELIGYDLGITLLPEPAVPAPVTLILITESDIQQLGRWPMADGDLATVIKQIIAWKPAVVGIDIYRDLPVEPGTRALDELFHTDPSIIGIFKFPSDDTPGVAAPSALEARGQVGFSDLLLDADSVVRRGLAFLDDGERVAWAFPLQVALKYLSAEDVYIAPAPENPDHFLIGKSAFPPLPENFGAYTNLDNAGYQFLIDYSRSASSFPTFSLEDLLDQRIPPELLRNRVVLLGANAESVKDSFITPTSHWPWSETPQVPGIAMHGIIVDQLIRASYGESLPFQAWSPMTEFGLLVAASLAGGLLGLRSTSVSRLLNIVLPGVLVFILLGLVLFLFDQWFPVLVTSLGLTISASLTTAYLVQLTRQERATLQKLLALQVSEEVAQEIWQRRAELLDEGALRPQQLTATVMFVDLQGFTQLTESLDSDTLMKWLNPILAAATRIIIRHGGMVDDYFGDGVKANFGVPIPRESEAQIAADARAALACARDLIAEADDLSKLTHTPYRLRFGIHTGVVITASVGSEHRFKYTSIGDTVNVAARLESLAKELGRESGVKGSSILLSASTVELLEPGIELDNLGPVSLQGRQQQINAYRIQDSHRRFDS